MAILHRNQTGIAGEYFAAAELTRRNFIVSVTLGNTKSIDLFAEKDGKPFMFQVKTIQRDKSITYNLNRDTIKKDCYYIFVNIHADTLVSPEYFILTSADVVKHLRLAPSGRDWIDYNYLKKNGFENKWDVIQ